MRWNITSVNTDARDLTALRQAAVKGDTEMITKDMIIGDVISEHPELVRTFFANGMMCIGCPASQGESIEAAAQVHGLDGDALTAALNEALA